MHHRPGHCIGPHSPVAGSGLTCRRAERRCGVNGDPVLYGHEGEILRYLLFHSLALAALMGLLIMAQAYVYPFTSLVGH